MCFYFLTRPFSKIETKKETTHKNACWCEVVTHPHIWIGFRLHNIHAHLQVAKWQSNNKIIKLIVESSNVSAALHFIMLAHSYSYTFIQHLYRRTLFVQYLLSDIKFCSIYFYVSATRVCRKPLNQCLRISA